MHQYHKYWEAVKGDPVKTESLIEIVDKMHKKLKAHCPSDYYYMLAKMHCVVYGPHFDEQTAKMAVANMHNVDGTNGEHWAIEQTNVVADQYNIKHKCDFYYLMNSKYSDYSNIFGSDITVYAKMSKADMCDPDGLDGQPFILWMAKMRYKEEEKEI